MNRNPIDVTDTIHRSLIALAALNGQSVKRFVLARTLGGQTRHAELSELEELLEKRIDRAKAQGSSKRTVGGIFGQARQASRSGLDA